MRRAFVVMFAIVVASSLVFAAPAGASTGGQDEASHKRFAGVYEADIPDMGTMAISVIHNEESGTLTLSAEAAPATDLEFVKGSRFKMETYEFGTIYIEFLESEEGEITSMAIDGYDFSFIAIKTG
jgi:hypothetical protein